MQRSLCHRTAALRTAIFVAVLVAGTIGAGVRPVSAALSSPVLTWAPSYMDRAARPTLADALALARRTDTVIAKASTYVPYLAAMRAANPAVRVLAYLNGTLSGEPDGTAFPSSWYARTAAGEQIQSVRFGNFLMNPRIPGWIESRVVLCQQFVAVSSYDGCALDVLGTAPVTPPFGAPDGYVTGQPIDAATGTAWTTRDWLAATTRLAATVRSRVAPLLVWGNGIGDGTRYSDPAAPTAVLFDGTDGMVSEVFLRNGRAPIEVVPSYDSWRRDLDMIIDAEARGRRLVVDTKVWTTASSALKDRWHSFSLGTFLLGTAGTGGTTRFAFLYDELADTTADHPWWHLPLGQPLAAAKGRANGTWERRFQGGRVIVNPLPTEARIRLRSPYRTLEGTVVDALVLPAHSGEVLLIP